MNKIWIYVVIGVAFWLLHRMYGLYSYIFLLVGLAVLAYIRRAAVWTYFARTAYFGKGDAKKGGKYFEKAYKTGEMSAECKIAYSSFCLRENNFEKGKKLLNEVINSRYSKPNEKLNAKHNLAVLIWHEGDLDGAIDLLEIVHKQIPATNTYGTLGVLYLERAKKTGNYENELAFLKEAYDYNESDKTIADNLGELYYYMESFEDAKELYSKLLEKDIYTPVPYYNYGRVLKALGDNEGAKHNFEKALNLKFTAVLTITRDDVQKEIDELTEQ